MLSFRALSTAITSWSSLSLDSRRTVSFPSCARLFTEPSSKRGIRTGFETRLGMNVWSAAEGESRAFSRRFWVRTKIETKGDSLLDRRFASKKKKKLKRVVAIRERILWENCINIIIVSRNFFPNPKRRYFDSIWISILIKAKNYWHWSVFEMEVSSVESITIMRIFFRGIGYLSNVYYS